mmetsp:Transcript_108218/g.345622  ORF Transcript_108218/g.345622 Transcript_108218/m.345622 type:complete len:276 (-) Transcript_108218:43-870(-)
MDLAVQIEFLRRGYFSALTDLFPGGERSAEKRGERWTCMEHVLDKRHRAEVGQYATRCNEMVACGLQVFLVHEADVENPKHRKNLCGKDGSLPQADDEGFYPLVHTNPNTLEQFHLESDRLTCYYTVDFDVMLWQKPWNYPGDQTALPALRDSSITIPSRSRIGLLKPVLLAVLAVLVGSISTGLDILRGERVGAPPDALDSLRHLRRNIRMYNQISHREFETFRRELGLNLSTTRLRLGEMIDGVSILVDGLDADMIELAREELLWLQGRLASA